MKIQKINGLRCIFLEPTRSLLEVPLISFGVFLGVSTLVLMLGLHWSITFATISLWIVGALALSLVIGMLWWKKGEKFRGQEIVDRKLIFAVFTLSLLCGLLTLLVNRPDSDDSVYVPKAVFYVENPSAQLDMGVNWIAGLDSVPSAGLFQYYETAQASISYLLGVEFLAVYHLVFPFLVGFFAFQSAFLLLSLFDRRRGVALVSSVFLIIITLCLGETHRAFGNVSLARAFQGKIMLFAVGSPLWLYWSLRYMVLADVRSWLVLLMLGTGLAGATSTAYVFLPFLSLLIFFSYTFNDKKNPLKKDHVSLFFFYMVTLTPLVLMALRFRSYATSHVASGAALNANFPLSFSGQLDLLVNHDYPVAPGLLLLSVVLIFCLSAYRRFFLFWVFSAFAAFLNPLISDFLIRNITTENIYWRMFYLLPFPLICGVAFSSVAGGGGAFKKILCLSVFAIALYFSVWGPTSIIRPENRGVRFSTDYKISTQVLPVAEAIVHKLPSGRMLAPIEISSAVHLLSSRFPQFHTREDYLQLVMNDIGMHAEFVRRVAMYRFMYEGDGTPAGGQVLDELLSRADRPKFVVVRNYATNKLEIQQALVRHYCKVVLQPNDIYSIYQCGD